jgi:CDGSH-type Zn-finger protein/uncharacterized Fe-S cluster protein YjdI
MPESTKSPIKDRAELVYLLAEAAEFEHTVMCSYLYALWSLKRSTDEGVTEEELEAIERWRAQVRVVALEEMLHLCLVNNLLAAFGASPHLVRPDFPVPPGRFPADLLLRLSRFDESTLQHFMYIERPLEIDIPDGDSFRHVQHYHRELRTDLLSPTPTDYESQGHLYHGIANGFEALAEELGEDALFAGHGEAQVDSAQFALPGLFPVTDLESAHRAIEEIVLQGEGAPAHREDSHYARFKVCHDELVEMKKRRPGFDPARPAAENPRLTDPLSPEPCAMVRAPQATRVVDLGNAVYTLMLRTFAQVFAPTPLPQLMRTQLAQAATTLMYALTTVGELATKLPIDDGSEQNAGLSLELPRSVGQLVQRCAAQILSERATELAAAARDMEVGFDLSGVADSLDAVAKKLMRVHTEFEEGLSLTQAAPSVDEAEPPAQSAQAEARDPTADINQAATDEVRLKFDPVRCIHSRRCVLSAPRVFLANVEGPWLHPEATSVENIVSLAENCPSGAITYERLDGGPDEAKPEVNVARVRENGPYAFEADLDIGGEGRMLRATLCRCGKSKNKPYCDSTHLEVGFDATGERATIESEPLANRGGLLHVDPTTNGPLEVTGNLEICCGTGHTIQRVQTARLCRCGGSANKPFCDNTHTRNGFRSDV